jgi:hypothetical protein
MDHSHLRRLSRPIVRPAAVATPAAHSTVGATPWPDLQEPASAVVRTRDRRRPVTACEVCGRTLLTGETSREIDIGDRLLAACPLCAIAAARSKAPAARSDPGRRAA